MVKPLPFPKPPMPEPYIPQPTPERRSFFPAKDQRNKEERDFQCQLLAAIDKQTEATQRMANMMQTLILALAEDDDPDAEPLTYMDGTPR